MKSKIKKVTVKASAACFEIEISAKITNGGALSVEEMENVKNKLKHIFTMQIPRLPHSHIYPFQVEVR